MYYSKVTILVAGGATEVRDFGPSCAEEGVAGLDVLALAVATTAGGPATPLPERATAPLPGGVRAGDDIDLKGGVGDDGRRACDAVGRTGHGASPGGGEDRR